MLYVEYKCINGNSNSNKTDDMSQLLDKSEIVFILSNYGCWAVFAFVAMESMGALLPGEAILVGAAIYAGDSHNMQIPEIVAAAAAGAIVGDNFGFWIGRTLGVRVLRNYGARIGLDDRKLVLGQYLFARWGGAVVFFGRFVALLRVLAAVLAGANQLEPRRFFAFNAAGGIIWACVFGFGGYFLGSAIHDVAGPFGWTALTLSIAGAVLLWLYFRRHEEELLLEAEALMKRTHPI
jgi:membrane protein DedA with SNARE-associated domain